MKTIVYLIRHAEQYRENGEFNCDDNEQEKNEKIILSVNGENQSKALSENHELSDLDSVWSSNYVRAKATAKYICYKNNLELNIDSRLNERKIGNKNELIEIGKGKKYRYVEEQLLNTELKTSDGENAKEVNERFTNFMNELIANNIGKKIAVVSHGAALRFYLAQYCNIEKDENKVSLMYKGNEIQFNSPEIIKVIFENNDVILIKNLKVTY